MLLSQCFIFICILINSVITFCTSLHFFVHFRQNMAFKSRGFDALFSTTTYEKISNVSTRFKGITTQIIYFLIILQFYFRVKVPSLVDSHGDNDHHGSVDVLV